MSIIHKIRGGGKQSAFIEAPLFEITEELHNPARGWYQVYNFDLGKDVDFDELYWCLGKHDRLALLMVDIGRYKDADLDETALERLKGILDFFVAHKYDIILRVVYDHEGKAMESEPFFFSQVESHMRQVVEVLDEYTCEVYIYQGILVGNWGEMHTSRFLSAEKMEQLTNILRKRNKKGAYLAVRKPAFWRELHPKKENLDEKGREQFSASDHMGLFDDGIYGDEYNLGTFGVTGKEEGGWHQSWLPEEEIEFEDKLCQLVPHGGEVLYEPAYAERLGRERQVELLRKMHISYLNRVHDARMIYYWKQLMITGKEAFLGDSKCWAKKSYFEYIGAHLGYRFLIKKAKVSLKPKAEEITVEITIENTGFGAFYQEGELILEIEKKSGEISWISIGQMKGWKSGETRTYSGQIQKDQGKLFLWANRSWDKSLIRLANESDPNGRVLLGTIIV